MTIPEAVSLVLQAGAYAKGGEIFILDMGDPVRIDDLARNLIKLSGLTPDVDIDIQYTGLRPGEKLYEELLSYNESTFPTDHSRIRIAKVREYNYADALRVADELERLSRDVDISTMVRLMKQVVPEFISKNSHFEVYDHISKA
jgi:FlaA1/EpsC-like NDP-sugar epimerase